MSQHITLLSAMCSLVKSGYTLYTPFTTGELSFVIEDGRGVLSKVLFKVGTPTDKTPVLTLAPYQQVQTYLNQFGFLLVTLPDYSVVWLIPISELPSHVKSVRLGDKWAGYILQEQGDLSMLSHQAIQEQVQARLKDSLTDIRQEDLEYLLAEEA